MAYTGVSTGQELFRVTQWSHGASRMSSFSLFRLPDFQSCAEQRVRLMLFRQENLYLVVLLGQFARDEMLNGK